MLNKREAKAAGKAAGKAAASWRFDGVTTDATYLAVALGIEIGDPAVLDQISPGSWLSGEWAGESMNELLDADSDDDPDHLDEIAGIYETAADSAYWYEIDRMIPRHIVKQARRLGAMRVTK